MGEDGKGRGQSHRCGGNLIDAFDSTFSAFIYLFFCYQVEMKLLKGVCVAHNTIINIFCGDRADLSGVLLLRLS